MTSDSTDTKNNDAPTTSAPTSSPPSVGPTYDRALVYDDDGKPWREKFHGLRGRVQQLENELTKAQKEHRDALTELQSELGERDTRVQELDGQLASTSSQLEELQALRDRIPELEDQARQAAKLRTIMEYPELINLQTMDTVDVDGEPQEVLVNPILDLVEQTSLEGDELRTHIRRLSSIIKSGEKETPPLDKSQVTDGAAPAPGESVEETPEYFEQKAREAHELSITDPSNLQKHLDDVVKYSTKAREVRAALQS